MSEAASIMRQPLIHFKELILRLGVEEATAESDACKIEHVLSDDTFNALKKHIM